MRIQDLKVIYICPDNNEKYKERKIHMDAMLKKIGFNDIVHYKSTTEDYPICVKKATVDILTKYIDWPFLLLEDDVESTGRFDFDFVPGADAIYFGLSKSKNDRNRFLHYSSSQIRITNMESTHAVLYVTKAYKQAVIDLINENLNNTPIGELICNIQSKFLILANKQPLFFQSENIGSSKEINTNIEIVYQPVIKDNYSTRAMRVGITAKFNGSAFDSSLPQVAVYLARAIKSLGHSVVYLIKQGANQWFNDCQGARNIDSVESVKRPLDLVVEVAWFIKAAERKQYAKKNVMFIHEPAIFKDMEKTIYGLNGDLRDFNNADALWTWNHISKNDSYYLKLLSRLPIFKSSLVWEPIFIDEFVRNTDVQMKQPTQILICENNRTNHSSCVIPLSILSQIRKTEPNVKWTVANSTAIYKKEYFIKNTVEMLNLHKGVSGNFTGRVKIGDYADTNTCIISHQRWLPLKYTLLDAMYLGIPLIHNCKLIKSMKGGKHYYEYNQINQALACWDALKKQNEKIDIVGVRNEIMERWGPEVIKQGIPSLFEVLFRN